MHLFVRRAQPVLWVLLLGVAAFTARAGDDCVDFKWDVSKERALFAAAPSELTAGKDRASAPVILPDRLYRLRLTTQDAVAFVVAPGKLSGAPSAFAGIATLKIAAPGSYRISIDLPSWIDVVADGALVHPTDFQGQHSCSAPHKIVVFDLSGTQPLTLQFSNAPVNEVSLTVTRAPVRKL